MDTKDKTLILFDVDGTLAIARKPAEPEVMETLKKLRRHYTIGIVGGSDFSKQLEQFGREVLENFDYVFSENGLTAFHDGKSIHVQSLVSFLGNDTLKKFVKKTLHLIADLDIPVQRGTFIELRAGMMNISPIGRNCSQSERDEFEKYDEVHHVRAKLIADLQAAFPDLPLKYSVGGQISFDVFPIGWDKTYCLQFVKDKFDVIHFFGDKTYEGGNDYEIFTSELTVGHSVRNFNETLTILQRDFLAQFHD
jgi:phosphomannomutase